MANHKYMRKNIFYLFLICSVPFFAQSNKWTLEACVEHALKHNISVKQSELQIETAALSEKDAFGNFLPSLNASATNSWNTGLTQNVTTGRSEERRVGKECRYGW